MRELDNDKVETIYLHSAKETTFKELTDRTKLSVSTLRLYLIRLVDDGRMSKRGEYPARYQRVLKKDWPNKNGIPAEINREAITALKTRITLGENDANELIKLTQDIYRTLGGDKLKAVVKLYNEITIALSEIAEDKQ